jgi:hypothetical protein
MAEMPVAMTVAILFWSQWHYDNYYDCLYLNQCPRNQGKHRADTAVTTALSDKKNYCAVQKVKSGRYHQ